MGRTVIVLSILAILAKIAGFAEKLVIARYFGTDSNADIYFATTGIILSIVYLIKELVQPSFLPVFAQTLKEYPQKAACLFQQFIFISVVVLLLIGIGLAILSNQVIQLFVPGFTPEKKEISATVLKLLSPAGMFLSLAMIVSMALNARKYFFRASVPETLYKILVLLGIMFMIPCFGLYAIPVVLLAGSFMLCISMLLIIPESSYIFQRNTGDYSHLLKVYLLMGPIVVGVLFSHVNGLIDNILASTLPTGQLSYLNYSKKLIDAILLIGPVALVTVSYSHLSSVSQQSREQYIQLFVKVLRFLAYASIPVAILIVALKEPIVQILFERGRFGIQSTIGTSNALLVYGLGFVAFSLESHLVCSFYAMSDTKTPVYVGILCVILDVLLAISLIGRFYYLGIAIAFVLTKTIKVIILLVILENRYCFVKESRLLLFFSRIIAACIPSVLLLSYLCLYETSGTLLMMAMQKLLLPAFGFLFLYYVLTLLLKVEEARLLRRIVFNKIGIQSGRITG